LDSTDVSASPQDDTDSAATSTDEVPAASVRRPVLRMPPDPKQRGSSFADALWDFLGTVDALTEILDEVLPLLVSIDQRPEWQADVDRICQGMAQADRDEINRFATGLASVFPKALEQSRSREQAEESSAAPDPALHNEAKRRTESISGPGGLSPDDPRLAELVIRLLTHTVARYRRPPKMSILTKASVTSLVDALELMMGQVVASYYRLHPGALGSDQKEFSLDDLKSLGSIGEAIDSAIDRRVDVFLRSGLADWEAWFKRNLKLDLSSLSLDWPETVEMIQRRHVLVHNGGRISQQYLDNVSPEFHKPVGTELVLDETYVRRALDLGTVLAVLLTMTAWSKLVPVESSAAAQRCHERAYLLMRSCRWEAVEAICSRGRKAIISSNADQVMFQLNEWLARKRIGNDEALHGEILAFDDSALAPRFALARNALLDNTKEAMAAAERGVSSGNVSIDELSEWPVLDELRNDPAFKIWLRDKQTKETARRMERRAARSHPEQSLEAKTGADTIENASNDGPA
jgi:hypothetical protein